MGLGGHLMWSAAFHEIFLKTGKRIFPLEHGRFCHSSIFHNNPVITGVADEMTFMVNMSNPQTNYCKCDTPTYAKHRYDKHIVQQILEFYKIDVSMDNIRPRLYLTDQEIKQVDELCRNLPKDFITIEPYTNTEYTVNREYPFDRWQWAVDRFCNLDIPVVQVGTSPKLLNGVIDLRGKTSFRTCAGVIGRSRLFMSTEGGLVHASTAMNTPTVCVITGYQHEDMVAYPCNKNLWIHGDHGPCGTKVPRCPSCWKAVNEVQPGVVVSAALELLNWNYQNCDQVLDD